MKIVKLYLVQCTQERLLKSVESALWHFFPSTLSSQEILVDSKVFPCAALSSCRNNSQVPQREYNSSTSRFLVTSSLLFGDALLAPGLCSSASILSMLKSLVAVFWELRLASLMITHLLGSIGSTDFAKSEMLYNPQDPGLATFVVSISGAGLISVFTAN